MPSSLRYINNSDACTIFTGFRMIKSCIVTLNYNILSNSNVPCHPSSMRYESLLGCGMEGCNTNYLKYGSNMAFHTAWRRDNVNQTTGSDK